jgi:hypothetical protein
MSSGSHSKSIALFLTMPEHLACILAVNIWSEAISTYGPWQINRRTVLIIHRPRTCANVVDDG